MREELLYKLTDMHMKRYLESLFIMETSNYNSNSVGWVPLQNSKCGMLWRIWGYGVASGLAQPSTPIKSHWALSLGIYRHCGKQMVPQKIDRTELPYLTQKFIL